MRDRDPIATTDTKAWGDRFQDAGLPRPERVAFSPTNRSVAVDFRIDGIIETIEGCGDSAAELFEDVARQLRRLLQPPS